MNDDSEWMSISDMMSGLMLIFMFIAISFMMQVQDDTIITENTNKKLEKLLDKVERDKNKTIAINQKLEKLIKQAKRDNNKTIIANKKLEKLITQVDKDKKRIKKVNIELEKLIKQAKKDKEKIENIAKTYYKDKEELNKALSYEFKDDLKKWEAEITKDNIIIFNSPTVLFNTGKSVIKKDFKNVLNDFFPRYIKVLSSSQYKNEIDEIRIEGHTSNIWSKEAKQSETYLKNMKLSQNRANNVLSYCYSINDNFISKNRVWLEKHFRANGMAFSKLKYLDRNSSIVDLLKSKRVEFRVQMKTEEKIYKILKVSN